LEIRETVARAGNCLSRIWQFRMVPGRKWKALFRLFRFIRFSSDRAGKQSETFLNPS
jgi:hypothetical protein